MSPSRNPALRILLGALLALSFTVPAAAQQDAQQLFDQGWSAYRQGDYEAARAHFRQIVASEPSNALALEMLHESQDAILQLMVAGGEFETFAKEILERASEGGRDAMRDADAAAQAAEGVFADDYQVRAKSIFALSQEYGPFGAPPLVQALGDADESRRLAAVYALSRMGSNVFLPVMAATHSTHQQVRMNSLHVLNAMDDARAWARVADMAANDEDGAVRALAAQIAQGSGSADVAAMHVDQGWAYFSKDRELGLSPTENYGVLWTVEGRNLQAYDVPQAVVPLELAKHHLLRAHELGAADAGPGLALVYATEVATLDALIGGGASLEGQRDAQFNALLTLGHDDLNAALQLAVDEERISAGEVLIGALDGPGGRAWSGLHAALGSGVPSLRYEAAIALAHQGVHESNVVRTLGAAVGLEALRIVQVIDGNADRAQALASALRAQDVVASVAGDGADGLVNMHQSVHVDAFVIADPLPDLYAQRVVASIRKDPRFGETPIFVLGNENTGEMDANVVDSVDAATVTGAFQPLDAERQRYLETAHRAAVALAHAAHAGQAGGAVDAMMGALDRDDAVAVPAVRGLGYAGDAAAASAMLEVLADTGRSSEVRTAAAHALARLHARTGAGIDAAVLESAMTEGDAGLARACARALGVMGAGHLSAGVSVQ